MSNLYRFKRYRDREEYTKETGLDAPPYDPSSPPKHWEDPSPGDMRKLYLNYTVIEMNRNGKPLRLNIQDPPRIQSISLRPAEASTLNLPDKSITGQLELSPEVPVPIRDLEEDEELVFGAYSAFDVLIRKK